MDTLKSFHKLSFIFVLIGGSNWGCIALFKLNLINFLFVSLPALERLLYLLIGLATLNEVIIHRGICQSCQGNAQLVSSVSNAREIKN